MGRAAARKALIGCLKRRLPRPGPAPQPWEQPQGWARARRPRAIPVHPSARPPPERVAAPAAVRCSVSPSPCGAARLGPAPTPRSPRRPPGPPSSAHVTAAGSPQTTLSATAGTHSHAVSGAGPACFRAPPPAPPPAPCLRPWLRLGAEQAGGLVLPRGLKGSSMEGTHFAQWHCPFTPRHMVPGSFTLWRVHARKRCCLRPASVLQPTCLTPSARYAHTIFGLLCTYSDEH